MKNLVIVLMSLAVFVGFGCKFGEQQSSEKKQESSERVSVEPKNDDETDSEKNDDSDNSEMTIPDLDFPDSEKNDESKDEKPKGKNKFVTVKFAKGKSSRTYKDSVAKGKTNVYTFGAAKGQTMTVKLSGEDGSAGFYIKAPNGKFLGSASSTEPTDNYSGVLPANGKYKIVVSSTKGESGYSISFSARGKPAAVKPDNTATIERRGGLTTVVRFRKGGTSATYNNAVIRGERNKYILGASAGQVMSVRISSHENNAVFDIQAPNGRTLVSGVKDWSGQLSAKGKYRIIVGGTRGNATYSVRFAVR